jgi:phosphoglycolate phosphatase
LDVSTIQGVLFDKDGTLFDFRATWEAWAASVLRRIAQGDLVQAAALGQVIGFDFHARQFARDSIVIAGTPGEVVEVLLPHLPGQTAEQLLETLNAEAETAPQAEVTPLGAYLSGLRALGLKLGLATNDAETPARAHLDAAGITELFDFISGFDSGYGAKPQPGQMLGFAAAVGLDPAQIVMVGDSRHDLVAGRAAGMACVAVLTGMADQATLAPYADAVLPDITALPAWIAARG